jgi:acetyl/propionyl-CoA carboxylase alpha subunit
MGESAVRVAQAFKYTNAGTVEFLVDSEGAFYFLEVNTRLQVEHPVTEMTTGLDLVRAQILVAAGEPLPFMQDEVTPFGHAVECRIYAEDAGQGFLPSTGRIECYVPPSGPNIRVDSGVAQGSDITVHYDPMLAKLITWGRTRTDALNRMTWALDRFVVLGVTTNIEFLQSLIAHPEFQAGRVHTEFLDAHLIKARRDGTIPDEVLIAAALAGKHPSRRAQAIGVAPSLASSTSDGPWHTAGAWRGI